MSINFKQLGQLLPADTNAASIYSPDSGVETVIKQIIVSNVTGNTPTFRIFLDDDGSTYSTATALFYDVGLSANETKILKVFIPMINSSGNLAVRSSAGSEINFTVMGAERTF